MAALPKRKGTKSRANRRRSHDALRIPSVALCPKCKHPKRPHFKCANCGFYGKVEKAAPKVEKTEKPAAKTTVKAAPKAKASKPTNTSKKTPKNETKK